MLVFPTPNPNTAFCNGSEKMAKKQVLNRNPNGNSKSTKPKNSPKIIVKNSTKKRRQITETANGDASSEDTKVAVVPSSSVESENDEVAESSEAEDGGVEHRSLRDEEEEEEEDDDEVEEEEEEEEEEDEEEEEPKKKPKSVQKKGKKDDAKIKGKKRSRKGQNKLEVEEKSENALYTFPMNRISRIVKSKNPDVKIAQEAVFVINRATEKFLQVFCKEAYACAFLDKKKHTAYHHLSSVVSKRERFQFLSDFVPEKVKAQDALPEAEAEK